jgi:ADP-ribose pyrophosphatase YjhB (NUDIX family)
MIRRKDTLGYVDFMRGKYSLYNKSYLQNIIDEMTVNEKKRLLSQEFDVLWKDLWGENVGIQYRSEERTSRDKLETIKRGFISGGSEYSLESLIADSKTKWDEPEWGFPKGRRNYQENDLTAALREFSEETGYQKGSLQLIHNLIPFEEIFTGSNYKSYKHQYFVAMLNPSSEKNVFQATEVSKLEWKTHDEAVQAIRPYNLEKKAVLQRVEKMLNEYRLYP